jgi:hypothetical protein
MMSAVPPNINIEDVKRRLRDIVRRNALNEAEDLAHITACQNETHLALLMRHQATAYGAMANFKGFVEIANERKTG